MASWAVPEYPRNQVDKAGFTLTNATADFQEYFDALKIINNWRSAHSYPLLNFRLNLARKLREIPETRASRLVAVTGYGTTADKQSFEEAGFDHYFPKPPDIDQLTRVLSD